MTAFVERIRELVTTRGNEFAYILLADEALLEGVALHAGEPWLDRCFPVDHRTSALPIILSKFRFVEAGRRAGLPLPRSQIVASPDAVDAARAIGYPVMIKRGAGTGGAGVRQATGDADVRAAVRDFGDDAVNVEEFVEGIVGATEALYDRGRPVCWVAVEKRKRYPGKYGPSAVRVVIDPPGMKELVAGCGAMTGFHGFVAICWQFNPASGRLALLEMNPRPGSGMHLESEPAEMFANGLRAMLEERTAYNHAPVPAGRTYRMFPQDLQRAIHERDVAGLCAWLPGLPTARDIPWRDRRLLRAQASHVVHTTWPGVGRAWSRVRERRSPMRRSA
jgi:hypothetical protein